MLICEDTERDYDMFMKGFNCLCVVCNPPKGDFSSCITRLTRGAECVSPTGYSCDPLEET